MLFNPYLKKASILIEQGRYDFAEKEVKNALAQNPDDSDGLFMLAIIYRNQNKFSLAEHAIQQSIRLEPDDDRLIFEYGRICLAKDDYPKAEQLIGQAISMDPYVADYHGLMGNIYLDKKDFELALKKAEEGLAVDPDSLICLNLRSMSLIKLDRKEEAFQTVEKALERDPDNAYTHTNFGWGELERGDHKKALEHFREALKLDPNYQYAQGGMIQALKARYWPYRLFLKYAFWVGNMKKNTQWMILIGLYVLANVLEQIANNVAALRPFLMPLVFLYIAFAISTWIIGPISNLFLRFNRYGRYALSDKEIQSSNFTALSLAISLIGFLCYFILYHPGFIGIAVFGFSMMIPTASMFSPSDDTSRKKLVAYTIALTVVGILGIATIFAGGELLNLFAIIYLIGLFFYQFFANAMMIK